MQTGKHIMTRVRTYLDSIRATQLELIAKHHGFNSIANYLDDHITKEWKAIHPAKLLPGFEIFKGVSEDTKEPTVTFAANGTIPVTLLAQQAKYLSDGMNLVMDGKQKSFFIASLADHSIIFFDKKGTGYRLMLKWQGGDWKRGLSESIAKDLRDIFYSESDKSLSK